MTCPDRPDPWPVWLDRCEDAGVCAGSWRWWEAHHWAWLCGAYAHMRPANPAYLVGAGRCAPLRLVVGARDWPLNPVHDCISSLPSR